MLMKIFWKEKPGKDRLIRLIDFLEETLNRNISVIQITLVSAPSTKHAASCFIFSKV